MAVLPEQKLQIVRTLVQSAPDAVVGGLQSALAGVGNDPALASVRRLVEVEAEDRRLRNFVFSPIAGLCVGDGRNPDRLRFPAAVLGLMWRGLKSRYPQDVELAAAALLDYSSEESSPEPFDGLVDRAMRSLRARDSELMRAAADAADAARPDGAAELCACLALAPIVRDVALRLHDWINRPSDDKAAAARLAYRDAVTVAEDAGPRFFEMLSTYLPEPWRILRLISVVMDRPSETYLAGSELSPFAVRILDDIDKGLGEVAALDSHDGPQKARAVAKGVERITHQISLLDEAVELARETGWGKRLGAHKKALAAVVERRLRESEKALLAALPRQHARGPRGLKDLPVVSEAPDEQVVLRARTLLTFVDEIRNSASHGGFASMRGKVLEALGEALDSYVEDLLDMLRHHEVPDLIMGQKHLDLTAEFASLIRDRQAGEIVRRRAAAAMAA